LFLGRSRASDQSHRVFSATNRCMKAPWAPSSGVGLGGRCARWRRRIEKGGFDPLYERLNELQAVAIIGDSSPPSKAG